VSAFVGRTNELQQLTDRLDRALGGEGGVVFITGEAGAGKSTLVERFLIDAALKAREARVISTGCSEQYGAGEPYQPFVDAFRHLVAGGEEAGGRKSFRELAKKLVDNLFAPRNAVDPADAYRAFRGRDAEIDALMRDRGFPVP